MIRMRCRVTFQVVIMLPHELQVQPDIVNTLPTTMAMVRRVTGWKEQTEVRSLP